MSLKNDVILMAEAHLKNVQSLIVDLEKQKSSIDQEIEKLQAYLSLGSQNVNRFAEEDSN